MIDRRTMRVVTACAIGLIAAACSAGGDVSDAQRAAISVELERTMREGYDLSKPNVAERMLGLYAKAGRVVSASGGSVTTSRDTLESGIRYFWNNVGVNMREPRWIWDRFHVDVLSRTSAVVTATYRIPHRNPRNEPHVLGGAMTVVFKKRDGRWGIIQEHLSDLPQRQDFQDTMGTHNHQ